MGIGIVKIEVDDWEILKILLKLRILSSLPYVWLVFNTLMTLLGIAFLIASSRCVRSCI